MKVLVLNYTHPEGYPPTFNAINNLSKHCKYVHVLSTDTLETVWSYDKNVTLELLPSRRNRFEAVKRKKRQKLKTYYHYCKRISRICNEKDIDLIIAYDNVPLFFYFLAKLFIKKRELKIWYHNHDVFPISNYKTFSVNWWGAIVERIFINKIDYFSLPANERKQYFSMSRFKGEYFFIPNYPSALFHGSIDVKVDNAIPENEINLVYPGNICFKHGFEELIKAMNQEISGRKIILNLIGDVEVAYKDSLISLAKEIGVEDQLRFIDRISYFDVPKLLSQFQVGWAVNKPLDVTYATGGTAANKIYEFLALGLPIILYNNEHYRAYHEENSSAFFTDLSGKSIKQNLEKILENYPALSKNARETFEKKYTFEIAFNEAFNRVKKEID